MRTVLQIPIDKELKVSSERLAEEYGFSSLQEVVRVFLNQFSAKKLALGFSSPNELLSFEQEAILTERYLEAKDNLAKTKSYSLKDSRELIKNLNS